MEPDRPESPPENEQRKAKKKIYVPPELKIHGTVEKLTESGFQGGKCSLSIDSDGLE